MNESTALMKIDAAQKAGSLVFVDKEWATEQTPLYKPEVTEMKINKDTDCFLISKKYMPKREVVDRIGEASGIDFIFGEIRNVTVTDESLGKHTVYIAVSQGRKMMSDGSWRTSSKCDYEFDPYLRAALDYDVTEINEKTKQKQKQGQNGPYGATLAKYILELQKVATQRANTGARLRVIRELVGMPTAFDAKDIEKPLLFGRMVQNTAYILNTPEGRAMATAKALGVDMGALFGKPSIQSTLVNDASSETSDSDHEDGTNQNDDSYAENLASEALGNNDNPPMKPAQELSKFDQLTKDLEDFIEGYSEELNITMSTGKNPYQLAIEELNDFGASEESRKEMIARIRNFLVRKGIKV